MILKTKTLLLGFGWYVIIWNRWTHNFNKRDDILFFPFFFYIFGQFLKIEINFTILKCTMLCGFCFLVSWHVWATITTLILEHFYHSKKKPHPHQLLYIPLPRSPWQPLTYFVSMDWPIPNISTDILTFNFITLGYIYSKCKT